MTPDHSAQPAEGVEALLPCPFCGTNPYLYTRDGGDAFIAVRCNSCGATTADFRNDPSNKTAFTGEPSAIAAWNRRTLAASRGDTPDARVRELVDKWRQPQADDECTLYTMGRRSSRNACADELAALLAEVKP